MRGCRRRGEDWRREGESPPPPPLPSSSSLSLSLLLLQDPHGSLCAELGWTELAGGQLASEGCWGWVWKMIYIWLWIEPTAS